MQRTRIELPRHKQRKCGDSVVGAELVNLGDLHMTHYAIFLKFLLIKSQGNSLVVQWLDTFTVELFHQVKNKVRKLAMYDLW